MAEHLSPLWLVRPTEDEAAVVLGLDHQDGARGQNEVVDLGQAATAVGQDDVVGHIIAVALEDTRDGALAEQAAQLRHEEAQEPCHQPRPEPALTAAMMARLRVDDEMADIRWLAPEADAPSRLHRRRRATALKPV